MLAIEGDVRWWLAPFPRRGVPAIPVCQVPRPPILQLPVGLGRGTHSSLPWRVTLLDNDPVHLRVILNDPWKAALALWPTFPLNVAMSAVGGASRSAASAQRGLLRDQDRWPRECTPAGSAALPLVAAQVQTGSRRRRRTDRKGARRAIRRLLDGIYTVSRVAQPRLLVTWWCNRWLASGFGLKQLSARSGYAPRFYGSGSHAWSMRLWHVSARLHTIALPPVLVTYAVACCRQ